LFASLLEKFPGLQLPMRGDNMFQVIMDLLSSAYVEIILLIVLLIAFFVHRKDPRLVVSGIRIVRTVIVVLIFFYFMFIWASTVQPTLRSISIFGMFLVNLFMFYNLILARLERPYRDALIKIAQSPENHDLVDTMWRTGKRFYYVRYAWSSLFSGTNPFEFLRDIAVERVREDIKDELRRLGVEKRLVSLKSMLGFLKTRLSCDENLPADFKEVMGKNIDDFNKHPWLEEQINEFLRIATEAPEELHFPEWMTTLDKCVTGNK
jgi:hypothetical protein